MLGIDEVLVHHRQAGLGELQESVVAAPAEDAAHCGPGRAEEATQRRARRGEVQLAPQLREVNIERRELLPKDQQVLHEEQIALQCALVRLQRKKERKKERKKK